ncbi:MAG TPA: response regulator transcription factor [Pseudonocardiaceae bacterium]
MRMLIVEDEDGPAYALTSALARRGFVVERSVDGSDVLARLKDVEAVVLDLGLPEIDGIELCRRIRAVSDVPIIAVTGVFKDVSDRILGLHAGADDYLLKPFDVGELVARVRAVLRRGVASRTAIGGTEDSIRVGDVEIQLSRHEVLVAGRRVSLARKEFALLALVAEAGGAVCTRERIRTEVWGDGSPAGNRTLDVHIGNVRAKLGRPWILDTVRGIGYRLGRPPAVQDWSGQGWAGQDH